MFYFGNIKLDFVFYINLCILFFKRGKWYLNWVETKYLEFRCNKVKSCKQKTTVNNFENNLKSCLIRKKPLKLLLDAQKYKSK